MSRSVCVFCASSADVPAVYRRAASELGAALARRGDTLVYGGGNVGLMGLAAQAALDAGGQVVGVIPQALKARELALEACTELIVTRDMHERKATMAARSDAFIALPGGFGTFEEITEVIAHRSLDLHEGPCILLNINGYWDAMVAQIERGIAERFIREDCRRHYAVAPEIPAALALVDAAARRS